MDPDFFPKFSDPDFEKEVKSWRKVRKWDRSNISNFLAVSKKFYETFMA
jgi:hypothetical protein